MDWFIYKKDEKYILLNSRTIKKVEYDSESNTTKIYDDIGDYAPEEIKGNCLNEIVKLLNAHGNYVSRIGE